jgi:argininosuccinate lyase
MSQPLWAKGNVSLNAAVQAFCAADDVVTDRAFFLHDIEASRAHAEGLRTLGIISPAELSSLSTSLSMLRSQFEAGTFVLDDRYEDGHSAIEAFLTVHTGDAGKKIHTGRSRNDQVLVAQRLYVRAQLDAVIAATRAIADTCLTLADAHRDVVMPGYTHLQRAMPVNLGFYFAGFAELFLDNKDAAVAARSVVNRNPLGTGAGFGVSLPLPRDATATALAFDGLVVNPLAAQTGRGKLELFALQALHLATLDVRRLAWDLSLFSTAEFAFVRLPDAYTTGSSLMPNKRNPDVVELLRALPAVVEGALAEIQATIALPSSYHRDLQGTKAPLVRACVRGVAGLRLVPALLTSLTWDEVRMRAAVSGDMFATDRALELVAAGVPFRDAYRQAAADIPELANRDVDDSLRRRVSPGAPGALLLDRLRARL